MQLEVPLGKKKEAKRLAERRKTAIHEAGHAVVCLTLLPDWVRGVELYGKNGKRRGCNVYFGRLKVRRPKSYTQKNLYDDLAVSFGGMEAERNFLGDVSNGVLFDVEYATREALYSIEDFGLPDSTPISYKELAKKGLVHHEMREELADAVETMLEKAHNKASEIIEERKKLVEAIAEALLKSGRLNREELLKLNKKYK